MFAASQLAAHAIGDYLPQSDWMGQGFSKKYPISKEPLFWEEIHS